MAKEDNLTPFTKNNAADMGARGGRAKAGSRHLSTIIREVLDNIDWAKTTLKNKDELKRLYGDKGWDAIVYVAITQSIAGDDKAREWLAKHGYGQKIELEHSGSVQTRTLTKDELNDRIKHYLERHSAN